MFLFFLIPKEKKEEKKVYVHTAIIAKKVKVIKESNKQISKTIQTSKKKIEKTSKKEPQKKGSKTNFTKGGENIGFNDIFKNVDYNITTKKVVLKEQDDMSRLKGVESKLKSVKLFDINSFYIRLTQNSGEELTDKEYKSIESKLGNIWQSVFANNEPALSIYYAQVKIENRSGKIYVTILDTNLDLDKQNELIEKIEKEKFNKEFDLTVFFKLIKEKND